MVSPCRASSGLSNQCKFISLCLKRKKTPKKGETAVHCCNPTLSVLVMLVSPNVFHVVSALQSIVCLHTLFLADRISCRSYVGSVYRMRSFAVSGFSFIIYMAFGEIFLAEHGGLSRAGKLAPSCPLG